MTKTNMDLSELLAKHDQGDFLRGIAEAVLQLIMETDVEGIIGAGRHERSGERTTWRNGYRERALDTRLGTLTPIEAHEGRHITATTSNGVSRHGSPSPCDLSWHGHQRPSGHIGPPT
ncbi:Transposase, Mutator family [Gemmobacter megaterium]|uniref:Transposase, Mutator family n=1 Tax=Gemmobacter megaterium TaxID=1086013 RepID=A0A1N7NPY1_9RHOB|nr:hypothetical protein GCM10011345_24060 [Gemmobacter megaterium]SIT00374.1 Transposase, Mutator family [Gemmobacter megaterium]